jgi:hypothetical protein
VNPSTKQPRDSIAKLRRCYEDKWDFTEKDNPSVFPIRLTQGSTPFGFCPAKVLRDDPASVAVFQTLTAILETGTWPEAGGINDQDGFWVDLVADFGPLRRALEFQERYQAVAKGLTSHGIGHKNAKNRSRS